MAGNLNDDRSLARNRFGLIFTDYLRRRFLINDNQERVQDVEQYQEQENFSESDEDRQDNQRTCQDVVRLLISAGDSIDGLQQVTRDYVTETLHLSIQEITERYQWIVNQVLDSYQNNSFGRLVVLFYLGYELLCNRWSDIDFKQLLKDVVKTIIQIAVGYLQHQLWTQSWDTIYNNIVQLPFVQRQLALLRGSRINSWIALTLLFSSILMFNFIRRT